jgi:hypothetical protein
MCSAQRAVKGNAKGSRLVTGWIHGKGNQGHLVGVWHVEGPEVDQRVQRHAGDLPGVASCGYIFCRACQCD